jgi:hypothetical protein
MNIGDRVRMVRGTEEGIITRFLPNNQIEIEIEDGFQIPVRASEIAVVSQDEKKFFGNAQELKTLQKDKDFVHKHISKNAQEAQIVESIATKGIYAGFLTINDQKSVLYLINNLDMDLAYSLAQEHNFDTNGLGVGVLKARQTLKIHEVNMPTMDNWGTYIFQFLYYRNTKFQIIPPFIKKIKFKQSAFFKNKKKLPILEKDGCCFQLDQDIIPDKSTHIPEINIDPEKLALAMQVPNIEKEFEQKNVIIAPKIISTPPKEIDLHIETLTKDFAKMNSSEMLQLQMDTFEKFLENGYASGVESIIFIHGVGNGVLRQEIHKKLSKSTLIKFFKDARKEKFGYGATEVHF